MPIRWAWKLAWIIRIPKVPPDSSPAAYGGGIAVASLSGTWPSMPSMIRRPTPAAARQGATECLSVCRPRTTSSCDPASVRLKWSCTSSAVRGPGPGSSWRCFTVAMRPFSVVALPLPFWWPVVRLRFLLGGRTGPETGTQLVLTLIGRFRAGNGDAARTDRPFGYEWVPCQEQRGWPLGDLCTTS
jgi:hypothetical protein